MQEVTHSHNIWPNRNEITSVPPLTLWRFLKRCFSLRIKSKIILFPPNFISWCRTEIFLWKLRAHWYENWSELKPVWNLKPFWKVVPFTWQFHYSQTWDVKPISKTVPFTWRFHCGNFSNHSKILMHMRKW